MDVLFPVPSTTGMFIGRLIYLAYYNERSTKFSINAWKEVKTVSTRSFSIGKNYTSKNTTEIIDTARNELKKTIAS